MIGAELKKKIEEAYKYEQGAYLTGAEIIQLREHLFGNGDAAQLHNGENADERR